MEDDALRWKVVLVAATLALTAVSAYGGGQPNGETRAIAWACTQEFDPLYHARCVPTLKPAADAPDVLGPDPGPATASPAATFVDRRPVSERGTHTLLNFESWRVPLYNLPMSPESARQLLSAVLCGRATDCTVAYELVRHEASLARLRRNPYIR